MDSKSPFSAQNRRFFVFVFCIKNSLLVRHVFEYSRPMALILCAPLGQSSSGSTKTQVSALPSLSQLGSIPMINVDAVVPFRCCALILLVRLDLNRPCQTARGRICRHGKTNTRFPSSLEGSLPACLSICLSLSILLSCEDALGTLLSHTHQHRRTAYAIQSQSYHEGEGAVNDLN
jgi:hypothetical protein